MGWVAGGESVALKQRAPGWVTASMPYDPEQVLGLSGPQSSHGQIAIRNPPSQACHAAEQGTASQPCSAQQRHKPSAQKPVAFLGENRGGVP